MHSSETFEETSWIPCFPERVKTINDFFNHRESGGMFEATRQALAKNNVAPGIITELDPDAPLRQNKTFHDLDVEDEQRLFRCVFELVRAGKLPKAQKLAMDQGYFMLAAGMQGWKAFRGNIRGE